MQVYTHEVLADYHSYSKSNPPGPCYCSYYVPLTSPLIPWTSFIDHFLLSLQYPDADESELSCHSHSSSQSGTVEYTNGVYCRTVGTTRGRVEEADPEGVGAADEGADHEEALRNAGQYSIISMGSIRLCIFSQFWGPTLPICSTGFYRLGIHNLNIYSAVSSLTFSPSLKQKNIWQG